MPYRPGQRRGYGPSTFPGGAEAFFSPAQALRDQRGPLGSISDILDERFLPEYEEAQAGTQAAEQAFQERLAQGVDYSSALEQIRPEIEGIIGELFGPGGQVEQASSQALRGTVNTGFGPTSGAFNRARTGILEGARGEVTNRVAQRAPELARLGLQEYGTELGALQQDVTEARGREISLLESLFGGQASVEQLELSRETQDLNRQIVEEQLAQLRRQNEDSGFFGDLFGGVASALTGGLAGGVASGVFGGVEDFVGGLFE